MKITVCENDKILGAKAATVIAGKINEAIAQRGRARVVLSTGASQFSTLEALIREDIDWVNVTMFHLDEYVGLPETHKASFRKYLKERFTAKVPIGKAIFVDGEGDVTESIRALTEAITEEPVDVAVVGIGENAHIAFNDPPADFETRESYIVVALNERCKQQQVGEGWFASVEDVPRQAITMTPHQIMSARCIVSPVPYAVKADAIHDMLYADDSTPMIPATLLKSHPEFHLFLDIDSAGKCEKERIARD